MTEPRASKTFTSVDLAEPSSSSNQQVQTDPQSPAKPAGVFAQNYQNLRDRLGFKKTYNLSLWLIFGGALFAFSASRLILLDIDGIYKHQSAPGEYYHIRAQPLFRTSFILHLATILPAGILTTLQFIPQIRHRFLLLHRLNGYFLLLLILTGTISGVLLAPDAFGGHMSSSSASVVIAASTLTSLGLAYCNIKVLQIDQHRKWMLRGVVYMSSIITSRLVGVIIMVTMASAGSGRSAVEVWPCAQLEFLLELPKHEFWEKYGTCRDGGKWAVVEAAAGGAEGPGSALRLGFGASLWIAFALHVLGVEVYIRLTGGENERLRVVSWERQLERGYKDAGSVGTTADRLGDADRWSEGKGVSSS